MDALMMTEVVVWAGIGWWWRAAGGAKSSRILDAFVVAGSFLKE